MANSIKNVAIFGASGNLGKHVTEALMDAGFNVTAVRRADSQVPKTYHGVTWKQADYGNVESLKEALQGTDAVLSLVATGATANQKALVDAAVAAGAKRFIPSEFGINTRILGDAPIGKIVKGKTDTVDYLDAKSKENPSFTWTGISNGLFFDWGLDHGSIGLNKKDRTALIYDSGNEPVQMSNVDFIGRAVVAVLQRPEATANRYLSIASFNVSQNQVLAVAEKLSGEKWTVNRADTADQEKEGAEKLARGDYSAFSNFLRRRLYGDGAGLAVRGDDCANALLGLEEESLEATVEKWLKE
ncbi:hypothetical protein GGR56DRAFT_531690 [Xylariaceae sp. FL0804]|nr:hypothetical protein GGR56DRAFT_531690 [Xylariaceae sp. FL0804]